MKRSNVMSMSVAMLVVSAGSLPALAQQSQSETGSKSGAKQPVNPAQPRRTVRSVRPPVIDLKAMAMEPRAGQVMPGDPSVYAAAPVPVTGDKPAPTTAQATPRVPVAAPVAAQAAAPVAQAASEPLAATGSQAHAMVQSANGEIETVRPAPMVEQAPAIADAPVARAIPSEPITQAPAAEQAIVNTTPVAPMPAAVPATGVDALIVRTMPAPMSVGPAKIAVAGVQGETGAAQWRIVDKPWKSPQSGDVLDGKIEVRAGIDAEVTVVIDDQVQMTVSRLGRVVIERSKEESGASIPSITLARGAIELRPVGSAAQGGGAIARIKTPDQVFGVLGALRVEYDAFTGTRRQTVNP